MRLFILSLLVFQRSLWADPQQVPKAENSVNTTNTASISAASESVAVEGGVKALLAHVSLVAPSLSSSEIKIRDEIVALFADQANKNNYVAEIHSIQKYGKTVLPVLENLLADDTLSGTLKWACLWSYSAISENSLDLEKIVQATLKSNFWLLRLTSLQIISEKKLVRLSKEVESLLGDKALLVRNGAITCLGLLELPEHAKAVEAQLQNPENYRRGQATFIIENAFMTLAKLNYYSAIPSLIEFLDNDNRRIALKADEALQNITKHQFLSKTFSGTKLKEHWTQYWGTIQKNESMQPKVF